MKNAGTVQFRNTQCLTSD